MAEISFQFSDAVGANSIHFKLEISPRKSLELSILGKLTGQGSSPNYKLSNPIFQCVQNISGYRTAECDLHDNKYTLQHGVTNHQSRENLGLYSRMGVFFNGAIVLVGQDFLIIDAS
jgi:hypothetical protein